MAVSGQGLLAQQNLSSLAWDLHRSAQRIAAVAFNFLYSGREVARSRNSFVLDDNIIVCRLTNGTDQRTRPLFEKHIRAQRYCFFLSSFLPTTIYSTCWC
jgi:hypothetical protein